MNPNHPAPYLKDITNGTCEICKNHFSYNDRLNLSAIDKGYFCIQCKNKEFDKQKETKTMNNLMTEIHQNAVEKGFWEDKENKNKAELLMLCVSELSEAMEADRKDRYADVKRFKEIYPTANKTHANKSVEEIENEIFERYIKDTFEDEIADTVIRLFDTSAGLGIDLLWHIEQKVKYNKSREYKHGKKY